MYTSSQVDIHSHKRKTYRETDILTYRQTERHAEIRQRDRNIWRYWQTDKQGQIGTGTALYTRTQIKRHRDAQTFRDTHRYIQTYR